MFTAELFTSELNPLTPFWSQPENQAPLERGSLELFEVIFFVRLLSELIHLTNVGENDPVTLPWLLCFQVSELN